ncbi:MAG: tryptophan--tRNA ligase, partial [Bacteroidia bacterium]|nr:tryptophan--tRNA ligase [Bacteroidia bacterium]
QMATLYLADSDDMIRKKVMKAKTDSGPAEKNAPKPDYIENIFLLMRLVSSEEVVNKFDGYYNNCSIRYGDMKKQLAEDMVKFITPIRKKAEAIRSDENYLKKVMEQGAEKARKSARATMELVREAIGLKYF